LGEGALQALIDGELPPGERAPAEAHLAACAECAAAVRELRGVHERAGSLLALADAPAPVAQATMALRARRLRAGRYAEARRTLARAALLLIGVVGVAMAVPGTGVHEWVATTILPGAKAPQAPTVRRAAPAPAPQAAAPAEASPTGVSIRADGGAVHVVLTAISDKVEVHARLVDGDLAGVLARGPAAAVARFRTAPGRIEVVDAGAGVLEVRLPRAARAATVEVNGRVYVAKDGDELRLLHAADSGEGPVIRVGG
jgi:anti-sigma factor RsiW